MSMGKQLSSPAPVNTFRAGGTLQSEVGVAEGVGVSTGVAVGVGVEPGTFGIAILLLHAEKSNKKPMVVSEKIMAFFI